MILKRRRGGNKRLTSDANGKGKSIFINLVVRRLNVYVGKERMLVFPVAILVAMTQKAVAMVVRGNGGKKNNSSLLVIKRSSCVF